MEFSILNYSKLFIVKLQFTSRLTPSFWMTVSLFVRGKPAKWTVKKATVRIAPPASSMRKRGVFKRDSIPHLIYL